VITDNFSNLLLHDNQISGLGGGETAGILCISSSPQLLQNSISGFGYGTYFGNGSSPVFEDAQKGGVNVITGNSLGVWCDGKSNAVLGFIDGGLNDEGGQNSIFDNDTYAVRLTNECDLVLAENNWWGTDKDPSPLFDVDGSSKMDYDPWLTSPPTMRATLAGGDEQVGEDPHQNLLSPQVRQAIGRRLRGEYVEAARLLKVIIGSETIAPAVKRWAIGQLLSVSQMMARPELSAYLENAIRLRPSLARTLRAVLPASYLHERLVTNAVAAYDSNIRLYPRTLHTP
jgi:hypothetical protein